MLLAVETFVSIATSAFMRIMADANINMFGLFWASVGACLFQVNRSAAIGRWQAMFQVMLSSICGALLAAFASENLQVSTHNATMIFYCIFGFGSYKIIDSVSNLIVEKFKWH